MKKALMAVPSVVASGVAALPVLTCPACWPLYAGLLGALGLGFVDYTPYLLPVTAGLLVVSLIPLLWKAKQRWGYKPLFAGILGAAWRHGANETELLHCAFITMRRPFAGPATLPDTSRQHIH